MRTGFKESGTNMPARNCSVCGARIPRQNISGVCGRCRPRPTTEHMKQLAGIKHDRDRQNRELAERWRSEHQDD